MARAYHPIYEPVAQIDEALAAQLSSLKDANEPLADPRPFYVHRGGHGEILLFSDVYRAMVITQGFRVPTHGVKFDTSEALMRLMESMRRNFNAAGSATRSVLDSLLEPYLARLRGLGGYRLPLNRT